MIRLELIENIMNKGLASSPKDSDWGSGYKRDKFKTKTLIEGNKALSLALEESNAEKEKRIKEGKAIIRVTDPEAVSNKEEAAKYFGLTSLDLKIDKGVLTITAKDSGNRVAQMLNDSQVASSLAEGKRKDWEISSLVNRVFNIKFLKSVLSKNDSDMLTTWPNEALINYAKTVAGNNKDEYANTIATYLYTKKEEIKRLAQKIDVDDRRTAFANMVSVDINRLRELNRK